MSFVVGALAPQSIRFVVDALAAFAPTTNARKKAPQTWALNNSY